MNKRYYKIDTEGFEIGNFALPQSFPTIEGDEDVLQNFKKKQYKNGQWIEGKTIEEDRNEKLTKLKEIRDNLLFIYSTPLNAQLQSEGRLELRGKLIEKKITQAVVEFYDDLFQVWRLLPDSINIDSFTIEEINASNTEIFGEFPSNKKLWDIST